MSTFSSFVDHYILLLAARYHAPLEDEDEDDDGAAWQQVSRALQHALLGPLTAEERKEMALVDVSLFTAPLVRQRALYLRWHFTEKARQGRPGRHAARPTAHSGFDITRDSLKTDVEAIYALARSQLPSSVVPAADETGSEEDADDDMVDENKIHRPPANPDKAGASVLQPVELPASMQASAADQQREAAFGLARDAFLTTIQQLQAEFYLTHRRWVDVAADVLEPPAAGPRAASATPPSNKRPSLQEERERLELLVALNGGSAGAPAPAQPYSQANARDSHKADQDAASAWRAGGPNPREVVASVREQLMRATSMAGGGGSGTKPVRPSAMTNEEMELYYAAQTTPSHSVGRPASGATSAATSAAKPGIRPAAAPAPLKDTPPPAAAGGRKGRWQIMEYADTNDVAGDSSSSSAEEEEEE